MGSSQMKPNGWWSRRHQTREPQDAARAAYQAKSGREARKRRAQERAQQTQTSKAEHVSSMFLNHPDIGRALEATEGPFDESELLTAAELRAILTEGARADG